MGKRRYRNRIEVDEGFDAGHPVADLLRTVPPDGEMSPEARDRLVVHMLSVRRRILRGGLKAPRSTARKALLPAMAVLVALAVLAAVLIPLLGGGGPAPEPGGGTARLDSPVGDVTVRGRGEKWAKARAGESLTGGDLVRTGEGSSVSVLFSDGSIMRVTDDSEARLDSLGAQSVSVEHVSGGTYHRVNKGTSYAVAVGEVRSRAMGTAFNVDCRTPGCVEVLSVESAVQVEIGEHQPIKLGEGEVIKVSTSGEKKAEKQSVTRERLNEPRLLESVRKDKSQGFSTGIYNLVDAGLAGDDQQSAPAPVAVSSELSLQGTGSASGVELDWSVPAGGQYLSVALLRSESGEPLYPDDVISSYEDTGMTSAADNNVEPGHTYQYRLCALLEGGQAVYSNTVVVSLPGSTEPPETAKVSLMAECTPNGVRLEWTVAGASDFDGFIVERTVTAATAGSKTPAGSTTVQKVDSRDVLVTWLDSSAEAGNTYTYRVGLRVGDAVMVYSDPGTVELKGN